MRLAYLITNSLLIQLCFTLFQKDYKENMKTPEFIYLFFWLPNNATKILICSSFFKIIFTVLFPLPFSLLIPLFPQQHLTVVHVHESFLHFAQSLYFLSLPTLAVTCSPSMSLSLFSLLVQFVHQIPHMSEVIWYLFFSDWLISLSIMFSSLIHTVAK